MGFLRLRIGQYIKRWDYRLEEKLYLHRLVKEQRENILCMSRKEKQFFLELGWCVWTQCPPDMSEREFSEMVFRLEQLGVVIGTWKKEPNIDAPHIAESCRLTTFGEKILFNYRCGKATFKTTPHIHIILILWYIFCSILITIYVLLYIR